MIRPAPFRPSDHVLGTLSQTHRRVGIVPSSDASLRYVLPIPRTWGRVCGLAASPAAGRSELLGIFAPTPDLSGPRIIVSVTRLRWDVDPIAWVRHRWETAGWSVAVARPLHPRWHPRFEVGALRCTEGEVEVRRCTGFVDNGRLLQVEVVAPSSQWPALHDLLWPCGVLLSLQNPTFRRKVEAQNEVGNPWVRFGLPASWGSKVTAPARAEACRWVASPQDGGEHSVALRIDVSPWPRDGIEPVASRQLRVRTELWAQGVALAGRIKRIPAGLATGAAGLMGLFSAKARDREERFEIRFGHRDGDGLSVDYTMAIASPERHPLDHMRAMRALEIAIASTDVVFVGHAYPPNLRPLTELTSYIEVGPLRKTIAVVGDRKWVPSFFGVVMSKPVAFERMPITYERAYGGRSSRLDERNPVGTGYCKARRDAYDMPLPNLEDPQQRIESWRPRRPVVGLGAIDAHWILRRQWAGTYDATWQAQRCPVLPRDFDPRFHCVGAEGLRSATPLQGELLVTLVHLALEPVLRFRLPGLFVGMDFYVEGEVEQRAAELWTVVLEPDELRVVMVWDGS